MSDEARPDRQRLHIAVGLLLLLIVYGSLYPLRWDFAHPQAFVYRGRVGLSDLVENVVLFLPLGWLLAWGYRTNRRFWWVQGLWFGASVALAAALQWLQVYLPRTPALSDIVFNALGHALGVALALATAGAVERLQQRHGGWRDVDRQALLLVALFIVAELFPLIPTLDRSTIVGNLKALWQTPWWQPTRMLGHATMTAIGLSALAGALRSAGLAHRLRPLLALALLGLLLGKFTGLHQSPGPAVVLGIAAGALLWAAADARGERTRAAVLLGVALFGYLAFSLAPYTRLRAVPLPMQWVPFASSLQNSIEAVIGSVAFECLVYGGFIRAAMLLGAPASAATLAIAAVALGCEGLQRYLPGRTPEVTSCVLALAMGWLARALAPPAPQLPPT